MEKTIRRGKRVTMIQDGDEIQYTLDGEPEARNIIWRESYLAPEDVALLNLIIYRCPCGKDTLELYGNDDVGYMCLDCAQEPIEDCRICHGKGTYNDEFGINRCECTERFM